MYTSKSFQQRWLWLTLGPSWLCCTTWCFDVQTFQIQSIKFEKWTPLPPECSAPPWASRDVHNLGYWLSWARPRSYFAGQQEMAGVGIGQGGPTHAGRSSLQTKPDDLSWVSQSGPHTHAHTLAVCSIRTCDFFPLPRNFNNKLCPPGCRRARVCVFVCVCVGSSGLT